MKTASINSPWAYIREGLLSEGDLRLRFGGLILGRAYFLFFIYFFMGVGGLLSKFYGNLQRICDFQRMLEVTKSNSNVQGGN